MADISAITVGSDTYNIKDATARNISGIYYGTCSGQAANQNKTVTVSSAQSFSLKTGVMVAVKFDANNTYSATASSPIKLNVNNTGAKQIYAANTAAPTGTNTTFFGRTNYINQYIYNGTYWVWNGSSADNNTTYTPQALGFGYGTCATAAATAAKVVTLSGYALVTNGTVSVKFTYDVPANATMNINSKGAKNIWYQGANITNNIIKAGDLATFVYDGTRYHLIAKDRDESGGGSDTWSSAVSGAVGATSVTISDPAIATTSAIDIYSQNTSGTPISLSTVVATTGQVVVSFDALTEATSFKAHIFN